MPYNPDTGQWEYGSQWDGVDTSDKGGSPFTQFPGSDKEYRRYTRLMNDDDPSNDPVHDQYGNFLYMNPQNANGGGGGGGSSSQSAAQKAARRGARRDARKARRRDKDESVFAFYRKTFADWGMPEDFADKAYELSKEARNDDEFLLMVRDTPEWKERFAGNVARNKAGLPVLSEAQYLQLETSYRQSMREAGLPKGFYDDPSDFANFIGNDVSPAELGRRATLAGDLAISKNPDLWNELKTRGITKGDAAAYILDPKRGLPAVERKLAGAGVGSVAREQGLKTGNKFENKLVDKLGLAGADPATAANAVREEMSTVAQTKSGWQRLAGNSDRESFTDKQLIRSEFDLAPKVEKKKRELASQERARFGGTAGSATAFGSNRV